MSKKLETLSKTLSYYLRHKPQELGVVLDSQGWVEVSILLQKLAEKQVEMTPDLLQEIVDKDSKGRYSIKEGKIRANQGHSTDTVDLKFKKDTPPFTLFHGTSRENWDLIKKSSGLASMNRHYVHLSTNLETATQVGTRKKDELVILKIQARVMYTAGFEFFISDNGVWLTKEVPLLYISE